VAPERPAADANFPHFTNPRAQRIDELRGFLGGFGFTLESSDAGLRKLDPWIARYGAVLAVRETGGCSFEAFVPAWRDERLGQNIIFDLASDDVLQETDRRCAPRSGLRGKSPSGIPGFARSHSRPRPEDAAAHMTHSISFAEPGIICGSDPCGRSQDRSSRPETW
jgi:hypothetical protein